MAKKKSDGINKSQEIRDYLAISPDAKPTEIVEELKKKGVDVDAQFVSTVKSNLKKTKGGPKSQRGPKKKAVSKKTATRQPRAAKAASASGGSGDVSLEALLKAKELVAEMGGIEDARNALTMLEQLRD